MKRIILLPFAAVCVLAIHSAARTTSSALGVATNSVIGPWRQVPGLARDIGVDAQGVAWIVSMTKKVPGGYAIAKRSGSTWKKIDGGAVRIAVAPAGDVWIVDEAGKIRVRRAQDQRWTYVPGAAREISIGPDGGVWKIGTERDGPDYGIAKYNGSGWDEVDGSATHLSVGSNGNLWMVKFSGAIFWRGTNDWLQKATWELQEGLTASDLAVDRKGPAWVLNNIPESDGNFRIYQDDGFHGVRKESWVQARLKDYGYTNGFHWHPVAGSAVRIVMQPNGIPWILKQDGSIYVSSLKPPSGNLFCTGFGGGYQITPAGDIKKFFEGGCNQAAFDPAGNLFLAVNKWSPAKSIAQILKFSPGQQSPTIIFDGEKDGIDNVYSVAVDFQGNLIFANWYAKSDRPKAAPADRPYYRRGIIFMLAPDKTLRVIDPDAERAYGLKCDRHGNLYNSGYGHSGDIYQYAIRGTNVTARVFGHVRWNRANDVDAEGNLFANGYMLIDPKKPDVIKGADGNWMTDPGNVLTGVIEIPKDGGPQRLVVPEADRAECHPVGVACDPNGDIYLADYFISPLNPGVIYRCSRDGTFTVFATGLRQPMWLVMEPNASSSTAGTGEK
jgi:Tectonin domain